MDPWNTHTRSLCIGVSRTCSFEYSQVCEYFTEIDYETLESIKDEELFASKYDSQKVRIKTPDIVMVFSNDEPSKSMLAKDHWKLFFIENDQLKEHNI